MSAQTHTQLHVPGTCKQRFSHHDQATHHKSKCPAAPYMAHADSHIIAFVAFWNAAGRLPQMALCVSGMWGAWQFNKRDYMRRMPPRNLRDPPVATRNHMLRTLIGFINEATQSIPCWNEYVRTRKRPATCDEEIPDSIYPKPPRRTPATQEQQ